MSGLSDAAKALLLAQYSPGGEIPPDSFTGDTAAELWKCTRVAAMARLQRGHQQGIYGRTKIGHTTYYHPPQPATK